MSLFVRPAAAAEIEDAYVWYEAQRAGLGDALLAELQAVMKAVLEGPEHYGVVHRQTRRALLGRFPYSVLYRIVGDDVVVVAFFHGSRDPRSWHHRK